MCPTSRLSPRISWGLDSRRWPEILCASTGVIVGFFFLTFVLENHHLAIPSEQHSLCVEHPSANKSARFKVVLWKTHKTGSTTLGNILFRFAEKHKLRFFCGSQHYLDTTTDLRYVQFGPYDIVAKHVKRFSTEFYDKIVPNGTWIVPLRDPVRRYISAFYYYVHAVSQVPLNNFLQVNNWLRMVHDFRHLVQNSSQVPEWMRTVFPRFDVFVIAEMWDESMVMLKDVMGWELEDVLYLKRNSCGRNRWDGKQVICPPISSHSNETLELLRSRLEPEYVIYNAAKEKLLQYIEQRGCGFWKELEVYRKMLKELEKECANYTSQDGRCAQYFLDDIDYEPMACQPEVPASRRGYVQYDPQKAVAQLARVESEGKNPFNFSMKLASIDFPLPQ